MKAKKSAWTYQPEELLAFLGVSKNGVGRRYILSCFIEVSAGAVPGMEVYEHVALVHGTTASQVVMHGQRALCKAQRKCLPQWEEIFPALNMNQAGLTLFLRHATAWLRHNRIAVHYLGHEKCRVPVPRHGTNAFSVF